MVILPISCAKITATKPLHAHFIVFQSFLYTDIVFLKWQNDKRNCQNFYSEKLRQHPQICNLKDPTWFPTRSNAVVLHSILFHNVYRPTSAFSSRLKLILRILGHYRNTKKEQGISLVHTEYQSFILVNGKQTKAYLNFPSLEPHQI